MTDEIKPFRNPFRSEYSQAFTRIEQKARHDEDLATVIAQIRSQLKDSIVLDIGSGEGDAMPKLAKESHAKAYIGVDIRARHNPPLEGAQYVTADIERYLENELPEGRHVVICNGFDREVTNVNYRNLAHQLRDRLRDPDIIFGFEVPSLVEELLHVSTRDGKPAFRMLYEHRESNFYVIRRTKEAI